MKYRICNSLSYLSLAFCALLFYCAMPSYAQAADSSLLLLPFQINAADESSTLKKDFPSLLMAKAKSQGYSVKTSTETVNSPSTAAQLARQAKVQAVLYGSVSQLGKEISIDAFLVSAEGKVEPIHVERRSVTDLNSAINELVQRIGKSVPVQGVASSGVSFSKGGIADIQVKGVRILDPELILARTSINKGDKVTAEQIDAEIRRIWDTGYFSDVIGEIIQTAAGETLLFTVVEKPRIEDVRVDGSDAIKLADVTEAMSTRTGSVLNEKVLAEDIQRITELYRKKGYYLVEVDYNVLTRANGTAALIFTVNEGKKLYIEKIVIEGLENLNKKDLQKYLSLKERGLLSFMSGGGILKEENLERDAQTIAAYAVNEGYIQAQVAAPEVTFDKKGITITYRIKEGPRFALGDISFAGNLIDTSDEFYKIIQLDEWKEKNTYFSLNTMQDDIRRLTQFYNDKGYAFAQIGVQDGVNTSENIINITFTLDPRDKVYINRVDVEGNYETRDNVILREMRLADGDMFSGAKLARTKERLDRTMYFKTVDIEVLPTQNPTEVDLKIKVEETNTGSITGGIGYSTYDGFGISGSITQDNLFGRGYKIGVQGYISEKELSVSSYFWNPRVYDTNIGAGVDLYALTQDWDDYDKDTVGVRFNFSYPLGEYTNLDWGYRLDQYKIYNLAENAASSIADYAGNNWASVINLGVVRDSTDSRIHPTKGTKVKIGLQYGGGLIGGTDHFIKPVLEIGGFYAINYENVLHARATVGAVFKNSDRVVPAFERFYIGGMNSIRGFSSDDISPRDIRTGEAIGSDRIAYASLEYIWLFEKDLGLSLVPFFDFAFATDSAHSGFFDKSYYSAGLELRWRSPMGDLRFAYGFPLTKNVLGESRSSGRFEFTMGQAF